MTERKTPIVKSLEALTRNPNREVSVEIAQISFLNGGAFSGYAVNALPNSSTLFSSDGRKFDLNQPRSNNSVGPDELRGLISSGNFELAPKYHKESSEIHGFDVFPTSKID